MEREFMVPPDAGAVNPQGSDPQGSDMGFRLQRSNSRYREPVLLIFLAAVNRSLQRGGME